MFDAAIDGFLLMVTWPAPAYMIGGVLLGLFFGAVPGLSGLNGLAILLPFTFGLDTGSAFALLLGMYAVTTTSDTLSAVLIGVPGTAAAQATLLDGYPLAQQGQAARALGAAYTWSAVGGVLGAVFLALSLPLVKPLILSFSEPEFFMLSVLGLTMVGSLSGSSIWKGLAGACVGVLIAMVGYAAFGGVPRYWFGANYLLDGVPLIPMALGLFGFPELVELAARRTSISRVARSESRGMIDGMKDAARHWWLGLRATAIGVYIGMLPGLGASIVDWVAYGHAVQSAKDKSMFGKGDIRGVIAPEAANNSMKGGALLPTIAFAIPGSAGMAILLGAFLIQGLEPGPSLLGERMDVSFLLVWTLAVANVLGALALMLWSNQLAKIIFQPPYLIIPAISLFIFMGAWVTGSSMGDWICLIFFGIIGWAMKQGGWARPPLILGFVLGSIMENGLHIGLQAHGWGMLTRPIVLALIATIVLTLWFAGRRNIREGKAAEEATAVGDYTAQYPAISLPLAILLMVTFVGAIVATRGWPAQATLFPLVAAVPGVIFVIVVIARDVVALRKLRAGLILPNAQKIDRDTVMGGVRFLGWILAVPLATLVIGQFIALVAFAGAFVRVNGRAPWHTVVIYSVVSAIILYVLFQYVSPVIWYESPLFELFG